MLREKAWDCIVNIIDILVDLCRSLLRQEGSLRGKRLDCSIRLRAILPAWRHFRVVTLCIVSAVQVDCLVGVTLSVNDLCNLVIDFEHRSFGASPLHAPRIVDGIAVHVEPAAGILGWRLALSNFSFFDRVKGLELIPPNLLRQVFVNGKLGLVFHDWVIQECLLGLFWWILVESEGNIALNHLCLVAPGGRSCRGCGCGCTCRCIR